MGTHPASSRIEQVSFDPITVLLKQAAPQKAADLETLLARLHPVCELDRESQHILFKARSGPGCVVRIGIHCTCRLQAHAYAAGIYLSAISTPGYSSMGADERRAVLSPADSLLTWAVGRDLQQSRNLKVCDLNLEEIMQGSEKELPDDLLPSLNGGQRILGYGLFCYATAFILLHELAHLDYEHTACEGYRSIQQEKDADRFAADWLLDSTSWEALATHRLSALIGMAVALLWLTVLNVYLGPRRGKTHPESYERLFQVLDYAINPDDENESTVVWDFVLTFLLVHMGNAGLEFDASQIQGSPRDVVNYLIDVLSKSGC